MNGINILKIILALTVINIIYAKEVFISFQYKINNYQLSFSRFECSYAMTHVNSSKKFLFMFPCAQNDILKCCSKNRDLIIDKLLQRNIIIFSRDRLINNSLNNSAKLTFLPHRFDIIIKNGVAYFYLKGE